MNQELKELMRQKRIIERRIRELKEIEIKCGSVKLGHEKYRNMLTDPWYIAIQTERCNRNGPGLVWTKWRYKEDKSDFIQEIDKLISDLEEMKGVING